jgi:hypothetical protein
MKYVLVSVPQVINWVVCVAGQTPAEQLKCEIIAETIRGLLISQFSVATFNVF